MAIKGLLISALAATGVTAAGTASAWASSGDGKIKFREVDFPELGAGNKYHLRTWDLTIKDVTGRKQFTRGFGATITEATVQALSNISQSVRDALIKDLVTPDGINLQFMRHTNGTSDHFDNLAPYSNNKGQLTNPKDFELGDRDKAMAKLLADMKKARPDMKIIGSPRAPPQWMKLDLAAAKNATDSGANQTYLGSYANYLGEYLQAYSDAGAPIDILTIQTELNVAAEKRKVKSKADRNKVMQGIRTAAEQTGALIRNWIVPSLEKTKASTKLWVFDDNTGNHEYASNLVNAATDEIEAVAWHCYTGNKPDNWKPIKQFHGDFDGDIDQYVTECWDTKGKTDWKHTSNYINQPLANGVNGVITGALATYPNGGPTSPGDDGCTTCTGMITVDPETGEVTKQTPYYIMGQYSKFIPIKDTRIVEVKNSRLHNDGTGIQAVATFNAGDGSRTIVIHSQYKRDTWVAVQTESEKKTWNGRVIGNGVTTWVLPPAEKKT